MILTYLEGKNSTSSDLVPAMQATRNDAKHTELKENYDLTRHRRCLCLGGMLCIHACLTKYAELKYTSSNESLLLLVEHCAIASG